MAALTKANREFFAQQAALDPALTGAVNRTEWAARSGFSARSAYTIGSQLGQHVDIARRVEELREQVRAAIARDPELGRLLADYEARKNASAELAGTGSRGRTKRRTGAVAPMSRSSG